MGNGELLKGIVESRADILGGVIISKGKIVEMYSRPDALTLPDDDMKRMVFQTEILVGMIMTNERAAGDTRFIMISHTNFTALIVPTKKGRTLAIAFTDLRDVEGLAKNVIEQAKHV